MRGARRALAPLTAVALGTLLAAPAAAQIGPGPRMPDRGRTWSPVVGARAGWNYRDQAPSAGAFLRLPVPVRYGLALTASGEAVFHDGLTDGQGFLDLTVDPARGLYLGGGLAALNTVFGEETGRATRFGWSFVGGLRAGGIGPVDVAVEFRWVRVDDMEPNFIGLTVGYAPFGRP